MNNNLETLLFLDDRWEMFCRSENISDQAVLKCRCFWIISFSIVFKGWESMKSKYIICFILRTPKRVVFLKECHFNGIEDRDKCNFGAFPNFGPLQKQQSKEKPQIRGTLKLAKLTKIHFWRAEPNMALHGGQMGSDCLFVGTKINQEEAKI